MTSGIEARGRFGKQDFVYLSDEDVYRCPAGEKLKYYYGSARLVEQAHPAARPDELRAHLLDGRAVVLAEICDVSSIAPANREENDTSACAFTQPGSPRDLELSQNHVRTRETSRPLSPVSSPDQRPGGSARLLPTSRQAATE